MYTPTELPIPFFFFHESDEISHVIQAPRYPFWVPSFSLSIVTLEFVIKLYRRLGTTELEVERKLEALGSRSRLSIPDIVCFIYGKALGLLSSTPVVPETWGMHTPGK